MPVSRETLEKLKIYERLLGEWQETMNLVSAASLSEAWARHFDDSLQLLPLIPEGAKTLYDLGSGAGFPGLVIAIARPGLAVHLIESTQKKCRFLEAVSRETGALNVTIHPARIEDVSRETGLPVPDAITARALTNLPDLLGYCAPWARRNSALTLIFPKGARWEEEVAAAREKWRFDLDSRLSETDPTARILMIRNLE